MMGHCSREGSEEWTARQEPGITLVIRSRDTQVWTELTLTPGLYLIGTSPHASIRLPPHCGVAPVHAHLLVQDRSIAVGQISQETPLFFNGQPRTRGLLGRNDQIRCGDFTLELHSPARSLAAAKPQKLFRRWEEVLPEQIIDDEFNNCHEPTAQWTWEGRGEVGTSVEVHRPNISAEVLLYAELFWAQTRIHAQSYTAHRGPVLAAASDTAQLPLWGFSVSEEPYVLANRDDGGFIVYPPPGSRVYRAHPHGSRDAGSNPLPGDLRVRPGESVWLCSGAMTLKLSVGAPPPALPGVSLRSLPALPLGLWAALMVFFGIFVALAPTKQQLQEQLAEHPASVPAPIAVKLLLPQPTPPRPKLKAKKEPTVSKSSEVKRSVPQRERQKAASVDGPVAPASRKAMKMLDRLTAAGPATHQLLASTRPQGGGKPALSGLIGMGGIPLGKGPGVAFNGPGGGLGGSELLRGPSGSGIGALGAKGFGRSGSIGGTVGKPVVGDFATRGTIDRDAVAKAVASHIDEVRACYERALLTTPGLAGKLIVEWVIDTNGRVDSARTKSATLRGGGVESCVLSRLRTWFFPVARGGKVIVSYPFVFNAVGS